MELSDKAIDTTDKLSKETLRKSKKSKEKLSRKPKTDDDFDFGFVDSLLDALNLDEDAEFDENFDQSGRREPKQKSEEKKSSQQQKEKEKPSASYGGSAKQEKPKAEEKCEDKVAKNKVQVCVPDYEVKRQKLYFKAQETYDEKYCYTKYALEIIIRKVI